MSVVPREFWGHLSVLNCGAGDLEFKFDTEDPQEVVRAKRVIEDMLRRASREDLERGTAGKRRSPPTRNVSEHGRIGAGCAARVKLARSLA